MRKLWQMSKVKMGEESIKLVKSYTQKGSLLLLIESHELWTLKPKLWTSQIWTLINNFVIVLICAKCSKLITLEENIISLHQLLLYLPLFFAFSCEVLNSDIKSCFDGVIFQVAVCEECFSIRFGAQSATTCSKSII